jgi:hypothetical protein
MSIVTVKTITIGMKARKALSARGIKSRLVKIDATQTQGGCQYGVEFNSAKFYDAIRALRENDIEYGVYKPK